jgi:radical SAM superfamily enzyme YgiQ (UPF0313 family)
MAQDVHGPLGLWQLGAVLREAGHEPVYCDLGLGDSLPDDCAVWALTGTTPQWEGMQQVARQATVPLVIGGPHASAKPDDCLALGAAVVVGEGEEALPKLLGKRKKPKPGIVRAARIKDLDALPWPDRSQQARYHYSITGRDGTAHQAATAITSRGCPHRCAFCSGGVWEHRVTYRSAANVLAEMAQLRDMSYSAIHFYDDSLALKKGRLKDLCDGLRDLGIVWRCFVRADQMSAETLAMMAAAGCVEIGMGVESGSQAVLDAIHKGETVEQQAAAIQWAHDAGVRVKAFVIVGLPGESYKTVADTERFLEATRPDDVDVTILQLYPGSALYEDPEAYGLHVAATGGWYKGRPGEYVAHHRTDGASARFLAGARGYLERRFKRWAA